MAFDRNCIVKEMARQLYKDYGMPAYEAFCLNNPTARTPRIERKKTMAEPRTLQVDITTETFTAVDQDHVRLCDLLDAKERAHSTWMNYVHTNRDPLKLPERVELDIKQHLAMKASNVADKAYAEALEAFVSPPAEEAP
jgi:hypothetical protein